MPRPTGKLKSGLAVAVHGATGRMGREILNLAAGQAGIQAVPIVKNDWAKTGDVDVVIDFSQPAGLIQAVEWCVQQKIPLVSGTTGMDAKQMRILEKAAEKIPLLWSANMSLGAHVLARALEALAHLEDWDFQIDETHHHHKKDKPSGTALFLQTQLEKVTGKEIPPPLSTRGGGIVGIHRVSAMGNEEILQFEHQALSRAAFARGALTAARWLAKRKANARLYRMSDVLFANQEP